MAVAVVLGAGACSAAGARSLPRSDGPSTTVDLAASDGDAQAVASGGAVLVIGDSLTVGIEPYLPQLVADRQVTFDAETGRPTSEGIAIVAAGRDPLPPTVIIALGTNDDASASEFSAHIDQMMALLGQRRVLWVNVARAGFDTLDTTLDAARARHPNLEVVDWASVIADHPEDVATDGVHCTDAGYELRAEVIARALDG